MYDRNSGSGMPKDLRIVMGPALGDITVCNDMKEIINL